MVEIRKYAKSHDTAHSIEDMGIVDLTTHIPRNRRERRIIEKYKKDLAKGIANDKSK
jgi:hypothetical protein